MGEQMEFVEATFRLPGGEWQIVIFSRRDVSEPEVARQAWESDVRGVFVRFPRGRVLTAKVVEDVLSAEFGVDEWERVRGPDSMRLR